VFAALSVLVLSVSISPIPAAAGDYYEGGYRSYDERPYYRDNWREPRREARYDRDYDDRRYYSSVPRSPRYNDSSYSYTTSTTYDRPYYATRRYDRPNYTSRYYGSGTYGSGTYGSGNYGYSNSRYSGTSYNSSAVAYDDQPRRFYPQGCRPSRYKVYDDSGGWVWAKTSICN
jgi:hypothetical protein